MTLINSNRISLVSSVSILGGMKGWKHRLNNLQLIIQPYIYFCLIKPWLKVFEIPHLSIGFSKLVTIVNKFKGWVLPKEQLPQLFFSSA